MQSLVRIFGSVLLIFSTAFYSKAQVEIKGNGNTSGSKTLITKNVDSDTSVVILDNGYVGIGTTEPSARLEINGHISQTGTGSSVFVGEGAGINDDLDNNCNTFMGWRSGYDNTTGLMNTFTGYKSGTNNVSGQRNTFIGTISGRDSETGSWNTFIGTSTGSLNSSGSYNLFAGYNSGYWNDDGNSNTFLGTYTGMNNRSGYNNVFIGYMSGSANQSGSNNIFIGQQSGSFMRSSNKLIIENSAADSADALIYGEFDNDILSFNGDVGIGTITPQAKLHVMGGLCLEDGTQATDRYLQCDEYGNTSWVDVDFSEDDDWTITNDSNLVSGVPGNVGIGTSNPSALLGLANAGSDYFENTSFNISIFSDSEAAYSRIKFLRSHSPTIDDDSTSAAVTLDGDKLGQLQFSGIRQNTGGAGSQSGAGWISMVQKGDATTLGVPGQMQFVTADGLGSRTERMVIDPDGKIGVGTTDPQNTLHVYSETAAALALQGNDGWIGIELEDETGAQTAAIGFMNNGNGISSFDFTNQKAGGTFSFYTEDAATRSISTRLFIDNDGDVGIGTASPSMRIDADDGSVNAERYYDSFNNYYYMNPAGTSVISSVDAKGSYDRLATDNSVLSRVNETTSGAGFVGTYGPNGNANIQMNNLSGYPDNGYLAVMDSNGDVQAGIFVDENGDGVISGDLKSFFMDHPGERGKEIWYASLEGPEAAAYIRGTAKLTDGKCIVKLPGHFEHVASNKGLTVQVTPLSAKSKGLAVIRKNNKRIEVRELNNGNGNYEFDFIVTGVRKGYENFRVIRSDDEVKSGKHKVVLSRN